MHASSASIWWMLLVGLTGGIGAGKSTVAKMLEERGAVVIDADDLARRVVEAGTAGFRAVVEAFGDEVVTSEGELDRIALASLVFAEPEARQKLEAIVHPEVARLFAEEAGRYRDTDRVLVYVVPLLVESHMEDMFDIVVVVASDATSRAERLAAAREMTPGDIMGRMDAQLPEEERERMADVVLHNDGSMEELEARAVELWNKLQEQARAGTGR
jgi:dephospho-CoA kinase